MSRTLSRVHNPEIGSASKDLEVEFLFKAILRSSTATTVQAFVIHDAQRFFSKSLRSYADGA